MSKKFEQTVEQQKRNAVEEVRTSGSGREKVSIAAVLDRLLWTAYLVLRFGRDSDIARIYALTDPLEEAIDLLLEDHEEEVPRRS